MLITLTCRTHNAPEIGYLLAKHPDSIFNRSFTAGKVWIFYPEVSSNQLTIALITEIDPIALVRGPASLTHLDQYVNDRPYVLSSLTSVALQTGFHSALGGRTSEHTERITELLDWEISLSALSCDGGENLIQRIFVPLGYEIHITRMPLDEQFPSWGESDIFQVRLFGKQTVQDALNHLYILLPILDNSKHYYVDQEETLKLLDHGGAWLATHPERELIARRYLRYQRKLIKSALTLLAENESSASIAEKEANDIVEKEEAPDLHSRRLSAVMEAIRACGAHSLADLGCGEGRLLELALNEQNLTRIIGMDVSVGALTQARRRLHLDSLPEAQRSRIQLIQGALTYRDKRLEGFDVATLVEVIEHLDPPRLSAMEEALFGQAHPRQVIITTPDRNYNAKFDTFHRNPFRHKDHRFEWTTDECLSWAEHIAATRPYRFRHQPLGDIDPIYGAPSQMLIFEHRESSTKEAAQ
jgi:3' terminal RNA ribose 2'-O-methyltransferase Hen1